MNYVCNYCGREYSRKSYFTSHQNMCELMHKSSDERRLLLEEQADTPDIRKLYEMLLALTSVVKKQEKQINKLNNIIQRTQKEKLSVIKWLDDNARPSQSFDHWFQSMTFDESDLNCILEKDHIKGMLEIVKSRSPVDSINTLPIRSFNQKKHVLYIYDGEKWQVMPPDQLKKFIGYMSKCIRGIFHVWVDENQKKIDNVHSDFSTTYLEKLSKVNGGKLEPEQIHSRIKNGMYEYLKYDLQNVIEYEFTF